jgi:high-affinity Fe2+/Pb2+ permease
MFGILIALGALLSRTNAENLTLAASVWGGATIAISVAALLIAWSSRWSHRVGQIVYELYGQVMAEHARAGMSFLRRAWYIGFATSIFVAAAIGFGLYLEAKPVLNDLRQHRVVTKSDLDSLNVSIDADIRELTGRLAHLEQDRATTLSYLEQLKGTLELEIESIRARGK